MPRVEAVVETGSGEDLPMCDVPPSSVFMPCMTMGLAAPAVS